MWSRSPRHSLSALVLLPLLAVTACGGGQSGSSSSSSKPIRIGSVVDQTGYLALSDKAVLAGVQLGADDLNAKGGILGRKIELFAEDWGADPNKAVSATQKLLSQEKIVAMTGSGGSAAAPAEEPLLARASVPSIASSVVKPESKWQVSVLPQAAQGINTMLGWLAANGKKSVGVLRDATPYNDLQQAVLQEQAKGKGITVVGTEQHASNAVDLRSQVDKLLAAKPDGIIKLSFGPTTLVAEKALADKGSSLPMLTANETTIGAKGEGKVYSSLYVALTGPQVYGSLPAGQRTPLLTSFAQKIAGRSEDPGGLARGWDQIHLLAQAIEKAKSTDGAAVRKALGEIGRVPGVAAPFYDFSSNPNGVAVNPFYLVNPRADGSLPIVAGPQG